MKRIPILIFVVFTFLFINTSLFAQREITKDISVYLDGIVDEVLYATNSDDYQIPADSDYTAIKNTIELILQEDYSSAATLAETYGYELFKVIDTTGETEHYYYSLVDKSEKYWGSFVFNTSPERSKLIIQCPHSAYDYNTGYQGALIFAETQPLAVFFNGAHRCNSTSYSNCDGTTTACGDGTESFRKSDQPHNSDGSFQAATEACEETIDSLIYIQLHGFSKKSTDPYIIMSNGSTDSPKGTDYLLKLSKNLEAIDSVLTFKIAHRDTWTRLIATTNTQGRLINNSNDPCSDDARSNSGRFLHLEQEKSRLRASESKWQVMADAIAATFPSDITSVEEDNDEALANSFALACYPNPFNAAININVTLNKTSNVKLNIYNLLGQRIASLYSGTLQAGEKTFYFDAGGFSSGVYFVTMQSQGNLISKKIMLMK